MRIILFVLLLTSIATRVMGSTEDSDLKRYTDDIIGNWIIGDSLYIITPKYVLYIPGKEMKCTYRKEVKGKPFVYEISPSKHFYAISKEGDYIFRAMRWYRIEGTGKDMRLDNRKFLITIGPIKIFSFDGGGVLTKISDAEIIKRLKEYNLDYNVIKRLPIETHQRIPDNATQVFDTEQKLAGATTIKDDSLPDVILEFLKQNKK